MATKSTKRARELRALLADGATSTPGAGSSSPRRRLRNAASSSDSVEEVQEVEDQDEVAEENGNVEEDDDLEQQRQQQFKPKCEPGDDFKETSAAVSLLLTDPQVLDCSICFEPLSIPTFQCDNGHLACSSCCIKFHNLCPPCNLSLNYSSCHAIEKVLESLQVSCRYTKYGCKQTLKYSEKLDHQKQCSEAPVSCPFAACSFLSSSEQLSVHVFGAHMQYIKLFSYGCYFRVTMTNDPFLLLREKKQGDLYILKIDVEFLGNALTIKHISPNLSNSELSYRLVAHTREASLRFDSLMVEKTTVQPDYSLPKSYLLIPNGFCGPKLPLKLGIRICKSSHKS